MLLWHIIPFSHRLLCLLPSLPFKSASLLTMLSRLEGGLRGSRGGDGVPLSNCTVLISPLEVVVVLVRSSIGIASGVPVPLATGDTLSDCSADIVHASISMPVLDWRAVFLGVVGDGAAL